jgi:hypothetical protein
LCESCYEQSFPHLSKASIFVLLMFTDTDLLALT